MKVNPLDHPICFSHPLRLRPGFAWVELAPFGMFLVDLVRPKLMVELGVHNGISYCAFCQAVQELGLTTRGYAVDTWGGDPHAGFYGSEVLADLQAYHDPRYGRFSQLLQSTFDQALDRFEERAIDLLHIDGLHTYEQVKHDWESWQAKLSSRGVVLFHDTNVREKNFGVWKLWEELAARYPHFELFHGQGLGLLAAGEPPEALAALLEASPEEQTQVREFFRQLGARLSAEQEAERLQEMVEQQSCQLTELQALVNGMGLVNPRFFRAWPRRFRQVWSEQGLVTALRQAHAKLRPSNEARGRPA